MPAVTEQWVRRALGLTGGGSEQARYSGVATDTRTLEPGALFVALAGQRFDAHAFLEAARAAGAAAAVVREGTPAVSGLPLFQVPDTLRAYGALARARRREIAGPVVAVTGTNGKTSTKEMIAAVLRTRFRTHATRLNLNNLVGVPQTILEAPMDTEALVIEAGASLPGEIARQREIVEPTVVVVTNVAEGHLEGFGSLDAVLAEKVELVRDVPLAVVGLEPVRLTEEVRARGARRVVSAGLEGADVTPDRVRLDEAGRPEIVVGDLEWTLPLLGRHQAANAMLAWAVGRELGVEPVLMARALAEVRVPGGRGEVQRVGEFLVINDCYNANPASFEAAIETAESLRGRRRLVVVAGTMRELGPDAEALHQRVAERLVRLDPDLLAAVGEFVPALRPWAARLGDRLLTADDPPALAPLLAERLRGDELIMLKASRGVALERVLPAIAARAATVPEA
ncbi:MAG TPA: UDP-N-acetylmuramoyl-tripeptide--D-alanyl-D-alanine ligase [Gemmatimonadales bacterium]